MNKLFTILLLSLAFTACHTVKYLPAETKIVIKDSVVERTDTLYRDTTIYLPGDEVAIAIPCPDAVVNEYEAGDRVKLSVKSDGKGMVKISCKTDSLQQVIKYLQTILKQKESFHSSQEVRQVPYPVEVIKYKIPKWLLYSLVISLLLNAWYNRSPILSLIKRRLP